MGINGMVVRGEPWYAPTGRQAESERPLIIFLEFSFSKKSRSFFKSKLFTSIFKFPLLNSINLAL